MLDLTTMKEIDFDCDSGDLTIREVYEDMDIYQKELLHFIVGCVYSGYNRVELSPDNQKIYGSLTDIQKKVFYFIINSAITNYNEGEEK